jgi:hypothetical protein
MGDVLPPLRNNRRNGLNQVGGFINSGKASNTISRGSYLTTYRVAAAYQLGVEDRKVRLTNMEYSVMQVFLGSIKSVASRLSAVGSTLRI